MLEKIFNPKYLKNHNIYTTPRKNVTKFILLYNQILYLDLDAKETGRRALGEKQFKLVYQVEEIKTVFFFLIIVILPKSLYQN